MKRMLCGLIVLRALLTGMAAGEARSVPAGWKETSLPDSGCTILIPEQMEYDGPDDGDGSRFAWLSAELGLEIDFYCYDSMGVTLEQIRNQLNADGHATDSTRIGNTEMLVYRTESDQVPGMKCIGYVLLDGEMVQEITFWYANQTAADLTAEIMESFREMGTL